MADPLEDHYNSILQQAGEQSPAAAQQSFSSTGPPTGGSSWLSSLGREAGIAGTRLAAPSVGLIHQIPGIGNYTPSYQDVLNLGPTPEGKLENVLAGGATAMGYALPAAALLFGSGAAGPLPILAGAAVGGAAGEARRQSFPNMPGGSYFDFGLGMLAGGGIGNALSRILPASEAELASSTGASKWPLQGNQYSMFGPASPPAASQPSWAKIIGSGLLGAGTDFAARHLLGLWPGAGYALGQGVEGLMLRSGLRGPQISVPGIAGGEAGLLLGPPPRQDTPTMAPGQ